MNTNVLISLYDWPYIDKIERSIKIDKRLALYWQWLKYGMKSTARIQRAHEDGAI